MCAAWEGARLDDSSAEALTHEGSVGTKLLSWWFG